MKASFSVKPAIKTYTLKLVGSLAIYASAYVTFEVILSDSCTTGLITSSPFNTN
jgi:hypothetical protein